jgi:hypothetical protein
VGLRSAYSESWFFLRAKPSRQYKDTAFFTAWASIWRTLANCKQISVFGTVHQNFNRKKVKNTHDQQYLTSTVLGTAHWSFNMEKVKNILNQ